MDNTLTNLLKRDTLRNVLEELKEKFHPHTLYEPPITFFPSYKFDKQNDYSIVGKKIRLPGHADRILFFSKSALMTENITNYDMKTNTFKSDHKPITCFYNDGSNKIYLLSWNLASGEKFGIHNFEELSIELNTKIIYDIDKERSDYIILNLQECNKTLLKELRNINDGSKLIHDFVIVQINYGLSHKYNLITIILQKKGFGGGKLLNFNPLSKFNNVRDWKNTKGAIITKFKFNTKICIINLHLPFGDIKYDNYLEQINNLLYTLKTNFNDEIFIIAGDFNSRCNTILDANGDEITIFEKIPNKTTIGKSGLILNNLGYPINTLYRELKEFENKLNNYKNLDDSLSETASETDSYDTLESLYQAEGKKSKRKMKKSKRKMKKSRKMKKRKTYRKSRKMKKSRKSKY